MAAPAREGTCRRWRPASVTDEGRARRRVTTVLAGRFAEIPEELVALVVDRVWERYDDAPVRDFVPVLVTREATQALSAAATGHAMADR